MFSPKLAPIGSIHGVGEAFVFGLAQHTLSEDHTDTVYLSIAGPVTSVESIWARLLNRRLLAVESEGREIAYLSHHGIAGEEGSPYQRIQRRIPGLQIDHLILLDKRFAAVEYAELGFAYLFEDAHLSLKLFDHVRALVNLPVFPLWAEGLAEIARLTGLLRPLACYGGQAVHVLTLDRTRWELEISTRLAGGELPWPGDEIPAQPLTRIDAPITEEAPMLPAPALPAPLPYTLTHEHDWTWLSIPGMPSEAIRDALKLKGFRWGQKRKAWYAPQIVPESTINQLLH